MNDSAPVLIPASTVFTPEEITFWADRSHRTLEQAIAEADLLVSAPHAGAAIPAEIAPFLAPEFTRRLQYDFTDVSTSAIVRRWAAIDPRVVVVENPHPRLIRDPNRQKPEDLRASLREAFDRVRAAGPYVKTDLTGVDAVRPVTFSFYPLLRVPEGDADIDAIADTFTEVATHGLGVYEATRDALTERFLDRVLGEAGPDGSRSGGTGGSFTRLSFHDTMNTTTTVDGAVNVPRDPADRLPDVVALSNRGDHNGDPIGDSPVTMRPDLVRELAVAHRAGFAVRAPEAVALNQPYLGSYEIIDAGARFRELDAEATAAGATLGAVQAEFLREYLLGDANTAILHEPGTGWVTPDPDHVDRLAHACRTAWDLYREHSA
ncbi:N-formylglutamate amidohydrolase [Plantibacter sp. YIM 135249]|uniref:N-formylglutamate amidohydrolase n=1 Tax=Plantibacter sp. YIM 135249 TaxID=3423918 RepID=UPI003D3336FC